MVVTFKKLFALVIALSCFMSFALADGGSNVVATYEGGEVTKAEVESAIAAEINVMTSTMNYFAQMTGVENYTATEDDLQYIREYVIKDYVQNKILLSKMAELGVNDLTDEEKDNLRKNAEFYFLQYVYTYTQQGMSADQAAYYLDAQGMSIDSIYENSYKNAINNKIADAIAINEEVTDEDISLKYEELCANYEKAYSNAPSSVESSANSGNPVYFMPDNMKYIKHIVLIPDDEDLMNEFESVVNELMAYENEYATVTAPSYEPRYDEIVEKAIKEECLENIEISKKALGEIQLKVLEATKPEADKILAAIESGESFDSLIETYSDDPGSKEEPIKTKGYLVYKDSSIWDDAFIDAANALENVGDVSEPVCGYLGVYIVKYESEAVSGKVALENIKDEVISSILTERKSEAFKAQTEKWYEEANIKLHLDVYN